MNSISILKQLGWPIPPREQSGMISCPYHKDNSPSMSINLEKGLYHCFSCGKKGKLVDLLDGSQQWVPQTPEQILMNKLKSKMLEVAQPKFSGVPKKVPDPWFKAVYSDYQSTETLDDWLKFRGLPLSVKSEYGVHFGDIKITYNLGLPDKVESYTVKNRLSIPIYDNGNLLSIEMRSPMINKTHFDDDIKKCVYPKGSKVATLFQRDKLDVEKPLFITEGLMDLIAFRSILHYNNSSSIFGAAISPAQVAELNKFKKITYVYNDDKAGWKSVRDLKEKLKGPQLQVLKPLFGCDDVGDMLQKHKNELTPTTIQKWVADAKSL